MRFQKRAWERWARCERGRVVLEDGHGLRVVALEALRERRLGVVRALHQRLALSSTFPVTQNRRKREKNRRKKSMVKEKNVRGSGARLVVAHGLLRRRAARERAGRREGRVVRAARGLVHPPAADALRQDALRKRRHVKG